MNIDQLPPFHDVEAPAMSVSTRAIIDRSHQLRHTTRRKYAIGVAAAVAAGAVAAGSLVMSRSHDDGLRPASHSSSVHLAPKLTNYFSQIDGAPGVSVPTGSAAAATYLVSETNTGAVQISRQADTASGDPSGPQSALTTQHVGGPTWVARDGRTTVTFTQLPRETANVWPLLDRRATESASTAAVLKSGRAGVLTATVGPEPTSVVYQRMDGTFSTAFGKAYGQSLGTGAVLIVEPVNNSWTFHIGGVSGTEQLPQTSASMGETVAGKPGYSRMTGVVLVPLDATDVRITSQNGASSPVVADVARFGYKVVYATAEVKTDGLAAVVSVSWTDKNGKRHTDGA